MSSTSSDDSSVSSVSTDETTTSSSASDPMDSATSNTEEELDLELGFFTSDDLERMLPPPPNPEIPTGRLRTEIGLCNDVFTVVCDFLEDDLEVYRLGWVSREFREATSQEYIWDSRVKNFRSRKYILPNRSKDILISNGKKNGTCGREVFTQVMYPFLVVERFQIDISEGREFDGAWDGIFCAVPVAILFLLLFTIFLLVAKKEEIGNDYFLSVFGSISSFLIWAALLFFEFLLILRILKYNSISNESTEHAKFLETFRWVADEPTDEMVERMARYFAFKYRHFIKMFNDFWGVCKVFSSLPVLLLLIFIEPFLGEKTPYLFFLWYVVFCIGDLFRLIFMGKMNRICDRVEFPFKSLQGLQSHLFTILFYVDFITSALSAISVLATFFLYHLYQKGEIIAKEDYLYIFIPHAVTMIIVFILFLVLLVVSIVLEMYNYTRTVLLDDDNSLKSWYGEYPTSSRKMRTLKILRVFWDVQVRSISLCLLAASKCFPVIFSPTIVYLYYLLSADDLSMEYFVGIPIAVWLPLVVFFCWILSYIGLQAVYVAGKFKTLLLMCYDQDFEFVDRFYYRWC